MKLRIIAQHEVFNLEQRNQRLYLNDQEENYTLTQVDEREFLIYRGLKVHRVRITESGENHLSVLIDGHHISLSVKDHMAQVLEQLGMTSETSSTVNEILAPMPGSILEVPVRQGQEVNKGDTLLILEAMKMENIIKSPVNGRIEKVHIAKGQNVEKKQLLLSFFEVIEM